jgi:hypothetical protein
VLCTADLCWTASDAALSIKEVDIGPAANTGPPEWVPKLVGNTSLLYELDELSALSRTSSELRSLH